MAVDLTTLRRKLIPETDGQDPARLRVGTVTAVNSDGTVDVTLNGTAVANVPVLDSADGLDTDVVVQMLGYRGSLLVLGPVRTGYPDEVCRAVSISPTANTPTGQGITYPSLGGTGTIVSFVSPLSAVPGSTVIEVSASSLTATSATVYLYRTNTTATTVHVLIRRVTA